MKTVFILGAGASHEYGYPLGSELNRVILERFDNPNFLSLLRMAGNNTSEVIEEFRLGLYRSDHDTIDQFLGAHRKKSDIRQIGKRAIAATIATFENESRLFRRQDWHWYKRFLDFLRKHPELAHREHFTFFTFNYDRSLEYYLYEAITRGGGDFSDSIIGDFFKENFTHIHGLVGLLPWQAVNRDQMASVREYGSLLQPPQLVSVAGNILLPDEDARLDAFLRDRLIKADRIIIMGFGFHPQNMKKILFDEIVNISNLHIDVTVQQLDVEKRDMLKKYPSVTVHNLDCSNFIGIPFADMYK